MKIIKKKQILFQQNLSNIFEIKMGQSPSSEFYTKNTLDIPFHQGVSNFTNKYPIDSVFTTISKKNAHKNDILLSVRAPVGRINLANKTISIGRGLCSLTLKKYTNIDYFYYIMKNMENTWGKISNGSIFDSVNKNEIENFNICYHENFIQQNNIAKILSKQEEQIETIKRLIKNVEKRNQYYSEKLLSGELRLRKNEATGQVEFYENTEWKEEMVNGILTKIPSDWNAESLTQNNFIIKSGIRRFSGTKKYYATANIGQNFLDNDFEEVTFENRPSRANFEPVKNSIWFAKMKGTYKNLLFKEENDTLLISSGMAGIQINIDRFDLNFMFHFIRSAYFNKLKDNLSQGGIQISINNDNINKIHFIYPENIYEQKKISFILNFYNDELKHLESLQKKEEKRFQWMLDNLLSGEYEVIDED